jgi:putative AlgH/UPF0301 family transcriptional regulator
MAAPTVTPAEVQAALDVTGRGPRIIRSEQIAKSATEGYYLVVGGPVARRTRWCLVTNTDNAATQVTAINAALAA